MVNCWTFFKINVKVDRALSWNNNKNSNKSCIEVMVINMYQLIYIILYNIKMTANIHKERRRSKWLLGLKLKERIEECLFNIIDIVNIYLDL